MFAQTLYRFFFYCCDKFPWQFETFFFLYFALLKNEWSKLWGIETHSGPCNKLFYPFFNSHLTPIVNVVVMVISMWALISGCLCPDLVTGPLHSNSTDYYSVRIFTFVNTLENICTFQNDNWSDVVYGRLLYANDLHVKDAVYHHQCSIDFCIGKKKIPMGNQD